MDHDPVSFRLRAWQLQRLREELHERSDRLVGVDHDVHEVRIAH
jgi:hypothetical protein